MASRSWRTILLIYYAFIAFRLRHRAIVAERGRQLHALEPKMLHAIQERGAAHDLMRHIDDMALIWGFEVAAAHPVVERTHRRPTPDLIIQLAPRLCDTGPVRRQAQIPAKDQRHAMLGVLTRAQDLPGIMRLEVGDHLVPDHADALFKHLP